MRVLFSTDGSKGSFAVERCLTAMGNREKVEVTVLTVGDHRGRVFSRGGISLQQDGWDADAVADAARSRVEEEGFSAASRATIGEPHEEIARIARDGGFDLTLIGGPHKSRPGPSMISQTGSLVISGSGSAVLVSGSRPRLPIQVLLVADGSDASVAAIGCFKEFADPRRCTANSLPLPSAPSPRSHLSLVGAAGRKDSARGGVADAPLDLVRSGHYGVVVCGVSLDAGRIATEPLVQSFLLSAPSLLIARG
jgi:nucleotide-binding universal stress UspA family protein